MTGTVGEIRMWIAGSPPPGWAFLNGQSLDVSAPENQVLLGIIGTQYGGDGINTFNLPDLRGRVSVHPSASFPMGTTGGLQQINLSVANLPSHTHGLSGEVKPLAKNGGGDETNPGGGYMCTSTQEEIYAETTNTEMAACDHNLSINPTGLGQPVDNMQPYMAINYIMRIHP